MKKALAFLFAGLLGLSLTAQTEAPAVTAEEAPAVTAEEAPAVTAEEAPAFESDNDYSGDWSISVGLSYRNFHRPTLKGGTTPAAEGYVMDEADGSLKEATPKNLDSAWNARYPGLERDMRRLTFGDINSFAASGHGSYADRERIAPVVGFSTSLWAKDALDLALVGNFQYYTMDTKLQGKGSDSAGSQLYDRFVSKINGTLTPTSGEQSKLDSSSSHDGTVNLASKVNFDMDLYVFDLGLSLGYNLDNGLRAFVAAGPTLSLADMESSAYNSVGVGSGKDSYFGRDNENEFNWGLYASAGAGYWFNETIGISAELRYDKAFGDVGTRYASQSLNTFGGMLKMQLRF